jgi:hypothetical protein
VQLRANGKVFLNAADLTDDDRNAILDLFQAEMEHSVTVRCDRYGAPLLPDGLTVASRCLGRLHADALAQGWTPSAAERLTATAATMYAELMAEVERQFRRTK